MIKEKLILGTLSLILIGYFAGLAGNEGYFGTRGEEKIYEFEYKGKSAEVVKKNQRFGLDKYYFRIGKEKPYDVLEGSLTSDKGELIYARDRFSINGKIK